MSAPPRKIDLVSYCPPPVRINFHKLSSEQLTDVVNRLRHNELIYVPEDCLKKLIVERLSPTTYQILFNSILRNGKIDSETLWSPAFHRRSSQASTRLG